MNWHGLNEWQQWALAIGGSLAAAFIAWLCRTLFKKRRESSKGTVQNASPVMTQTFEPTINIHPPSAPPTKARSEQYRSGTRLAE